MVAVERGRNTGRPWLAFARRSNRSPRRGSFCETPRPASSTSQLGARAARYSCAGVWAETAQRTAGEVRVLGFDPAKRERALRKQIGIVLQSTGVDPYLTVAETVDLYRGYYPSPRPLDEVIEVVGLTEKRDTRVIKLSGGQQRRLDVAIALAGDPRLLFLDEPTTGFDPGARRNAWQVVKNLQALGKTIFLTTHYMDEAQYLANRVAVIARGEIVAEGPPGSLGGRDLARTLIRFRVPDGAEELPQVGATAGADGMLEIHA